MRLRTLGLGGRLGKVGERAAARYLRRAGYRILGVNLRSRLGEIDILAEAPDGRTIVVVEVKAAAGDHDAVRPEERVGFDKQRKLVVLASHMARRYDLTDRPIRFDVIGVDLSPPNGPVVRHHPGAFEAQV